MDFCVHPFYNKQYGSEFRVDMAGGGTHIRHLFRSLLPAGHTCTEFISLEGANAHLKFIMGLRNTQEHVPLFEFTTMRVGGPARFFCKVKTTDELKSAVEFAKKQNLPIFILGEGSNILVG